MTDRHSLIVRTALAVFADGGARALTHRGIDREAGLPLGSAANIFSTHDALVTAVVDEVERLDAAAFRELAATRSVHSIADAAEVLVAYVAASDQRLTRARLALFLTRPEAVRAGHGRVLELLEAMLAAAGVRHPAAAAQSVAAYLDGNALHTVTGVTPAKASPDAMRAAVTSLLMQKHDQVAE